MTAYNNLYHQLIANAKGEWGGRASQLVKRGKTTTSFSGVNEAVVLSKVNFMPAPSPDCHRPLAVSVSCALGNHSGRAGHVHSTDSIAAH